jgi:hypothetical protein
MLDGLVGAGTFYGLDGLGFEHQWVQEIIFSILI